MECVLSGMIWKSCFAYIDDVLVGSRTFDEHLNNLQQVFSSTTQSWSAFEGQEMLVFEGRGALSRPCGDQVRHQARSAED